MPWTLHPAGPCTRLHHRGAPASRAAFLGGLAEDPALRALLTAHLRAQPAAAVFWECPVIGPATADQPMEWATLPAAGLDGPADPRPFAAQLRGPGPIATFDNLSGDATLIVPRPAPGVDPAHLLAFLRSAPAPLADALWTAVGAAGLRMNRPFYLSTAGMGVAWLHVRLDARPKYYRHAPYRRG